MEPVNIILLLSILTTQVIWAFTSPFTPLENIKMLLKNRAGLGSFLSLLLIIQTLRMFDIYILAAIPLWLTILGTGITITGAVLACWAKFTMKNIWGTPAQHDRKRQNRLITSGPFAFSRNPIYVGLFMIFIGTELALGSMFILLSFPLIILIHQAVLKEEKLLGDYFKKKYGDYKKKTPRYLYYKNSGLQLIF